MTAIAPARRERVLVTRLDSVGDVLLTGPAVRVLARQARVTFLAGPRGEAAARLLPGVEEVLVFACPWIDAGAPPVVEAELYELVHTLRARRFSAAAVLGSSHQSPLPTALVLRMAGIPRITAVSHEYPGSLLDDAVRGDPDMHEVERHLAVVARLGHHEPGDDLTLAVDAARLPARPPAGPPYVVVHPGASVPARTLSASRWAAVVAALVAAGRRVVVTAGPGEADLAARVAGAALDAEVRADPQTLGGLAALLGGAEAVVCGNTGPTHLAAAVGTPVVCVFPPTVPAGRWRPWGVPHVLLGDQDVACAGCRAQVCPLPHQQCLDPVTPEAVVAAVAALAPARPAVSAGAVSG